MKNNDNIHAVATDLVLKCGIPPSLVGCDYLTEAVELYSEHKHKLMALYEHIAENNDIKLKSVMRDIAYAISQSHDIHDKLSEMLDIPVDAGQIHRGLVISYLALELDRRIAE